MERPRAAVLACRQTVAQRLIADRSFKKAFQQGAQVKAGASRQNGKPAA